MGLNCSSNLTEQNVFNAVLLLVLGFTGVQGEEFPDNLCCFIGKLNTNVRP